MTTMVQIHFEAEEVDFDLNLAGLALDGTISDVNLSGKGQIIISFNNQDDLNRILDNFDQ